MTSVFAKVDESGGTWGRDNEKTSQIKENAANVPSVQSVIREVWSFHAGTKVWCFFI